MALKCFDEEGKGETSDIIKTISTLFWFFLEMEKHLLSLINNWYTNI